MWARRGGITRKAYKITDTDDIAELIKTKDQIKDDITTKLSKSSPDVKGKFGDMELDFEKVKIKSGDYVLQRSVAFNMDQLGDKTPMTGCALFALASAKLLGDA